jgi:hypothetical protein
MHRQREGGIGLEGRAKALCVLVVAVLAMIATSTAAASTDSYPPDDPGWFDGCYATDLGDPTFIDGACVTTLSDESVIGERDLAGNVCKRVLAQRVFKSWSGFVVWRYKERVRFCYNGRIVTSSQRFRWATFEHGGGMYWSFEGHVANSCRWEDCSDQEGTWKTYYGTQGKFQACLWSWGIHLCTTRLPGVGIEAFGNGVWHWNTWG